MNVSCAWFEHSICDHALNSDDDVNNEKSKVPKTRKLSLSLCLCLCLHCRFFHSKLENTHKKRIKTLSCRTSRANTTRKLYKNNQKLQLEDFFFFEV